MFSDFMATFFANAMPYIGLLWAVSFAFFIEFIMTGTLGQQTSLIAPLAGTVKPSEFISKDA